MPLAVIAYLAGVLTILSPCILPVLPFVFARAGRSFRSSTLPMLAGMVLSFAAVASLAALGGAWAVRANEWGRLAALAVLAGFGLLLLWPALADRLTRPVVALGGRLAAQGQGGAGGSLLLGVATGLLWAPCAGPVLGLILTGAALNGANLGTTLLLATYAAGAATALALAVGLGGRVARALRRWLGAGEWLRRVAGALVLVSVAAITLGLDTGVLTRLSLSGTERVEQALIDRIAPGHGPAAMSGAMVPEGGGAVMTPGGAMMAADSNAMMAGGAMQGAAATLPVEAITPSLDGAMDWLNTPPLSMQDLRGKVVLVDFWTYSCINCLRAIPHVRAWAERYADQGLVVIGVHSPEFAFEKRLDNVAAAADRLGITYPVAIDNDYAIWRTFDNRYWPAHYFIDAEGRVRHHQFGEGGYDRSEQVIRQLLAEAGKTPSEDAAPVSAEGASAPSDLAEVQSPETYIGYLRAQNFAGEGGLVLDASHAYAPAELRRNEWDLTGTWTAGPEHAVLDAAPGGIGFRFRARDLHLVLTPAGDGRPVRFQVTIDGQPPGADHGTDVAPDGTGTVTEERLYQLIRQQGPVADRDFEIRFLDPGVRAYAFTFG